MTEITLSKRQQKTRLTSMMELLEHWGKNPDIGDLETMLNEFFRNYSAPQNVA